MSVQSGERDPREDETQQRAIKAMREARAMVQEAFGQELPGHVVEAFDNAERELFAASECRLAKPFAPIIQIGDTDGLYYACTHNPSHRY
ncbi:hypothetical protein [Kribbella sp.]|uniref:hypothetical protein n=1 Tax=Kribbella sp. TaxID=1871183 RepID=UPI002D5A0F57|nr:hypothetical protein [Kribbella sp.]HZX04298.1 hypothetical protein [Kribbella sp.]